MPGGDRSGPGGQGPMTGRGLGYCSGKNNPGFTAIQGYGLGRGYRRGRGQGRGYGIRGVYKESYNTPYRPSGIYYYAQEVPVNPPIDQLTMLKQEKNYLESELKGIGSAIEDISSRIEELEKKE
ncbi:MAG: DUF5320 domain-containing protein [Candidatus Lokiarchaeota archaeon]|nr:DUF5320 domain-containing protein [Candidatus Lokiarchaeota archaeon]